MKIYIPDYYKEFECIASRCKDSCCIGWDIMIDERSRDRYQKVRSPFKQRLEEGIISDDEGWQFLLDHKKRCVFLNDQNLCDIYIELGEEALCDICTQHPRFHNEYGDIRQSGLGMACEEAARLILEGEAALVIEESEEFSDLEKDEWADELMKIEIQLLNLLGQREYTMDERIDQVFDLVSYYQEEINQTGEISSEFKEEQIIKHHITKQMQQEDVMAYWFSFYEDLDYMDENFKKLIKNAGKISMDKGNDKSDELYKEHLMSYFIYRHFMKAYEDDNLSDKIKFAIISLNVIIKINAYCQSHNVSISKTEAARRYSKEIEYSQENMEQIFEELLFN